MRDDARRFRVSIELFALGRAYGELQCRKQKEMSFAVIDAPVTGAVPAANKALAQAGATGLSLVSIIPDREFDLLQSNKTLAPAHAGQ